ncbi:MAG: PAS domain-containing protein [Anaerolineae bacterium]|nr:PAS domain-containing protein [Anaerolineae bacterium]
MGLKRSGSTTLQASDGEAYHAEVSADRDRLQAILDANQDAMLLFDTRGRLIKQNATAEDLLAAWYLAKPYPSIFDWLRTSDEIVIRHLTGLTRAQFRQHMLDIVTQPQNVTWRQFKQIRDDDTYYIHETGSPVLDREQNLIGWLVVWHDATEERRFGAAQAELGGMIVHDLRTPLTAIISSLNMLEEFLAEDEIDLALFGEIVQIAHNSSENMLHLVQSLLDVARIERDDVMLDCESYPLIDVVENAVKSMRSLALRADIDLVVTLPDNLPAVWIDEEKIERVLINLLDNALRFTPAGGQVTIEAVEGPEDSGVIVYVSDTGPGIPPEARELVFNKFTQLKNRPAGRGHKGAGLGLTFCKLAIEAHGGRIWIENRRERGALFCFVLPTTPFNAPPC